MSSPAASIVPPSPLSSRPVATEIPASPSSSARSGASQPRSTFASKFTNASSRPRAASAPRLQPAQKPMFSSKRTTRAPSRPSQLPSLEPESTTMSSASGSVVPAASAASDAARQRAPLWLTSTTESSGTRSYIGRGARPLDPARGAAHATELAVRRAPPGGPCQVPEPAGTPGDGPDVAGLRPRGHGGRAPPDPHARRAVEPPQLAAGALRGDPRPA